MRRISAVLLLGGFALSSLAFAEPAQYSDQEAVVVCVRFQDTHVPVIDKTYEAPYERFCVKVENP